jgi:hypothetical protein
MHIQNYNYDFINKIKYEPKLTYFTTNFASLMQKSDVYEL